MYPSLGLTSAELKALILITRILIKVNTFLEEHSCGIHTLMCWRKAKKKVKKLLLKVCQFSNSNSTTLKSKIITLKCNWLKNLATHLIVRILEMNILKKKLNSRCYPETNFTAFSPAFLIACNIYLIAHDRRNTG